MKRHIAARLVEWKNKKDRKPLLMKGARQVGKTYSLKAFGEDNFAATHYINFEKEKGIHPIFQKDLNPNRIINELKFYLHRSINVEKELLIFDEIQACPEVLTSLKYFQEEMPELALCAAGSLLGVHLGESSFPVGKVDIVTLFPLCFEEFLQGVGEENLVNLLHNLTYGEEISRVAHSQLWQWLKIYFVVGGLPEVVTTYHHYQEDPFVAIEQVRKKQQDLILAYNADMAKHAGKVNAMHIERLWRNIPEQLAREQDGSVARFKFKGILPSIHRYERLVGTLDWLEAAGLILKCSITHKGALPFSAYTKENLFKLYMFDIGLLGALSELSPKTILDYDYGSYKGYFAENFVAQEFICAGTKTLYSWKENSAEVEFVREVNGNILPIEVKSGWVTQAKSLKVFADKYQSLYRTIMSGRPLQFDDKNKVHHYPLYLAYRFPLKKQT